MVIVLDGGETVEDGMVELASANVDAKERGENEVKEEVEHCWMLLCGVEHED